MIAIVSFLLFCGYATAETVTMRWAKDAGRAPTFHQEDDGSLTVEYPIFEGTYEDIEPIRRRLQTMTQAEIRTDMLDYHNELRSTTALGLAPCKCGSECGRGPNGAGYHPGATNMNQLFWDYSLEKVAQTYSDKCLFIHNTEDNNGVGATKEAFALKRYTAWDMTKEKYVGENLYVSSTGEKKWISEWNGKDYGIKGGLYGWWIECEDYQYPEGGSCGGQVGHYTQYIRADARFVGCGVTICPNGVKTKTSEYTWANLNVVCNYFGGQFGDAPYKPAYTTADIASECEPDRIPNKSTGLCEGAQKDDYFENPQTSYTGDKTTANGWICNDGTEPTDSAINGRDANGCGTGSTITNNPTPYPTVKPTNTERPTNKPSATKYPTKRPTTDAPTPQPVTDPTPRPTPVPTHVITSKPTDPLPTKEPIQSPTPRPTPYTKKPTNFPTARPVPEPTPEPTAQGDTCNKDDCTFVTKVEWISETYKYNGLAKYAFDRYQELTNLQSRNGWSSYYSWGGYYQKNAADAWELYIYDDIEVTWGEMECSLRDSLTGYMRDGEAADDGTYFVDSMKQLITSDMRDAHGDSPGYISGITTTVTCSTTDAAAFGAIDEDGNIELPFSTWNLNTYDFSDWFVLLFVLFTGCACCFGCGWAMHRRRVFKAMDDASISDFSAQPEAPMVTMDGNASPQNITTTNDDYNQTYATHNNEPEIEIGVSVNSNNRGIMAEDDSE